MAAPKLSDWIVTPAPFNRNKCGRRAVLSKDCCIVRREEAERETNCCVCYTLDPLPMEQVWQITIRDVTNKNWGFGLKVGVTTTLPDVVHHTLLWNNARPQEWNYVGSLLWHNRQKLTTDLPSLHGLHLDQKTGLLLTVDGDLHVYLDGQHIKRVASGLPVSGQLWGAVDVSGSCSKVKSELLSGAAMCQEQIPSYKHLDEPLDEDSKGCEALSTKNDAVPILPSPKECKVLSTKKDVAPPLSSSTPRPTLPKLVKIDLPSQVAPNISTFGILLLEDKYGNKMDIIKKKALGDPLEMAIEVLREWLAGRGVEVTWEGLIDTLRDCELTVLADQIQMSLDQKSL